MPDVIVVGAGIVGCAVSDALLRQGCRVHLINPRGIGLGATNASAGMLTPFSEGRHHATLEALGARSLGLYDGFIEQTIGTLDRPHWYARTGSLEVAVTEAEAPGTSRPSLITPREELTAHCLREPTYIGASRGHRGRRCRADRAVARTM